MWTFVGKVAHYASVYRINSLANVKQRIEFYFLRVRAKNNITKQTFCRDSFLCLWILLFCPLLNKFLPKASFFVERALKFHTDVARVTTHIWVVILIGRASWEICLNQSKALPSTGRWRVIGMDFLRVTRHFAGISFVASRNRSNLGFWETTHLPLP